MNSINGCEFCGLAGLYKLIGQKPDMKPDAIEVFGDWQCMSERRFENGVNGAV
jgi:hypothetical protein